MKLEINQEEITKKISEEILKEIEESGTIFSNEEIQTKINDKLEKIFKKYESEEEENSKLKEIEDEKIIEKEFKNINDNNSSDDHFNSLLNNIRKENEGLETKGEEDDEEEIEESEKEKKKFFQEFTDLYKSELTHSLSSFKNSYDSFKLFSKTSIVEKVLILFFLAIPAIFGGMITLLFILILLLLWQFHILLKVITSFFDRIENSIKETIEKIKKKITDMKNGGGFFNKLIFSNFLYSLIMFNGVLYMFIKGMMLPLKSVAEIDKILANLMSKGLRTLTVGLKSPSELALANLRPQAIKSGRVVNKSRSNSKNRLKLKKLSKSKEKLLNKKLDLSKKPEIIKDLALKNMVINGVAAKITQTQLNLTQQQIDNLVANTIVVQHSPFTSKIPDNLMIKNDLSGLIFANVLNRIKDEIEPIINPLINTGLSTLDLKPENLINNDITVDGRIRNDIIQEKNEKQQQESLADQVFIQNGVNPERLMAEYTQNRETLGQNSPNALQETLNNYPDLTQEQKLELGYAAGSLRNAREDIDNIGEFSDWNIKNPEASFENYLTMKYESSKEESIKEVEEFANRYTLNGEPADCNKLIDTAMKENGFDQNQNISEAEFKKVAFSVAEKFPEEQRADIVKDLRERNLSYIEHQQCKQELKQEQSKSLMEKFAVGKGHDSSQELSIY